MPKIILLRGCSMSPAMFFPYPINLNYIIWPKVYVDRTSEHYTMRACSIFHFKISLCGNNSFQSSGKVLYKI